MPSWGDPSVTLAFCWRRLQRCVRGDQRRIFCSCRWGGRVEKVDVTVSRHFRCSLTLCSSQNPSRRARKSTPPSPLSSALARISAGHNSIRSFWLPRLPPSQRPADPWAPHVSLRLGRRPPLVKVPWVCSPLLVIPFVCLRGCHCDLCRKALICHCSCVFVLFFFVFLSSSHSGEWPEVCGWGRSNGRGLTFSLRQESLSAESWNNRFYEHLEGFCLSFFLTN